MRTVVKTGGAQLDTIERVRRVTAHVQSLRESGRSVVLVHGGGGEIGALHERLEVPHRTDRGLRITSEDSMEIVTMVLCGLVNKRLVGQLVASGVPALGISGVDLGLMRASFLNRDRLGRVGGPPTVNEELLKTLLENSQMLVLSPVCLGPDAGPVNVNADMVAQAVAIALDAESLEFVTDVDGVQNGKGNVGRLSTHEVETLIRDSVVAGGMIPKLQAAVAAVDGGVDCVRVGSTKSLARGTATEVHA